MIFIAIVSFVINVFNMLKQWLIVLVVHAMVVGCDDRQAQLQKAKQINGDMSPTPRRKDDKQLLTIPPPLSQQQIETEPKQKDQLIKKPSETLRQKRKDKEKEKKKQEQQKRKKAQQQDAYLRKQHQMFQQAKRRQDQKIQQQRKKFNKRQQIQQKAIGLAYNQNNHIDRTKQIENRYIEQIIKLREAERRQDQINKKAEQAKLTNSKNGQILETQKPALQNLQTQQTQQTQGISQEQVISEILETGQTDAEETEENDEIIQSEQIDQTLQKVEENKQTTVQQQNMVYHPIFGSQEQAAARQDEAGHRLQQKMREREEQLKRQQMQRLQKQAEQRQDEALLRNQLSLRQQAKLKIKQEQNKLQDKIMLHPLTQEDKWKQVQKILQKQQKIKKQQRQQEQLRKRQTKQKEMQQKARKIEEQLRKKQYERIIVHQQNEMINLEPQRINQQIQNQQRKGVDGSKQSKDNSKIIESMPILFQQHLQDPSIQQKDQSFKMQKPSAKRQKLDNLLNNIKMLAKKDIFDSKSSNIRLKNLQKSNIFNYIHFQQQDMELLKKYADLNSKQSIPSLQQAKQNEKIDSLSMDTQEAYFYSTFIILFLLTLWFRHKLVSQDQEGQQPIFDTERMLIPQQQQLI